MNEERERERVEDSGVGKSRVAAHKLQWVKCVDREERGGGRDRRICCRFCGVRKKTK